MFVIIAMDGNGNVSWGDGQQFVKEAAEREASRRNSAAERDGSDWLHMTMPAKSWED